MNGKPLKFGDITDALSFGLGLFKDMPLSNMGYAAVFMLLGLLLLTAIVVLGVSPLVLPFAGGFMLLGPVLLTGYFELALCSAPQCKPSLAVAFAAFGKAPSGLWLVALVCVFLLLIWITDAGDISCCAQLRDSLDMGQDLPLCLRQVVGNVRLRLGDSAVYGVQKVQIDA